jgi:hypothetical protein
VDFPEPSIPSKVTKNPRRRGEVMRRGSTWADGWKEDAIGAPELEASSNMGWRKVMA